MKLTPLSPVALKATGFFSKQTNTFSANAARERLKLVANEDQYGYWFTDKGVQLDVDEMQHDSIASKVIAREHYQEYFKWVETVDQADYKQFAMQVLGWIRVTVTGTTLGVEIYPSAVANNAYRAFTKFVNSEAVVDEYLLDVVKTSSRFLPAERKQALFNDIKKQIKNNTLEAALDLLDQSGAPLKYVIDPTPERFIAFISKTDHKSARGLINEDQKTIWWDAGKAIHSRIAKQLMLTGYLEHRLEANIENGKAYVDYEVWAALRDKPFAKLAASKDVLFKNGSVYVSVPEYTGKTLESSDERKLGKSLAEQGQSVVIIYRACALNVNSFLDRDYVTLSKKFAIEHAEHNAAVNDEQQHVIKAIVMGKNVFDAYNPGEYFYSGPDKKGKEVYKTELDLEASTDVYGYWFTHKGEMLEVEPEQHASAFYTYKSKDKEIYDAYKEIYPGFVPSEDIYNYARNVLGWIRIVSETVNLEVNIGKNNVSKKAFYTLTKFLKEDDDFRKIYVDISDKSRTEHKTFEVTETRELLTLIRDNIKKTVLEAAVNLPYGYWVTPKGELLEVDTGKKGHVGALKDYMKTNELNLPTMQYNMIFPNENYAPLFNRGWVRLVRATGYESYDINMLHNSLTPKTINTLIRFLKDFPGKVEVDFINTPEDEWLTFENRAKLVAFLKNNTRKTTLEAATNEPYGYWITDKGELLKVENDLVGHIGVLHKYSKANNYGISSEDWETIDEADYWPVLSRGWIRIVFERFNDMGIEIAKKSVSPAAAKKLSIYLKGLKDKNFTIDVNKSPGRYEIDYEDTPSKSKIISLIEQNVGSVNEKRLEASTVKHFITIAADNEIIDHSTEETLETWHTDTGIKLVLVYTGKAYFIREFSANNELVTQQEWAFLETARQSLLGIVRLAQDSGVFFKRETTMTAADTVLQRWEASDKKYAIELAKSDEGALAVSAFIKGDISQVWHKVGTSYLGKRTEEEAVARVQEDMNIYKKSNSVTFKKVKEASVEKPRVIKKPVEEVQTRTSTTKALPTVTEVVKESAAGILNERKAALKKAFALVEKGRPIPEALKIVKERDRAYVKMEISKKYAKRGMKDIKAPRIEPPPSKYDRRMVGSYVVGLNSKGTPIRGMLLTQRKDKVKRHYGWIAILDENSKPTRVMVTNVTRTLTKPPKDLVKAYEHMLYKIRTTMSRS